jgi:hypothetical protein
MDRDQVQTRLVWMDVDVLMCAMCIWLFPRALHALERLCLYAQLPANLDLPFDSLKHSLFSRIVSFHS